MDLKTWCSNQAKEAQKYKWCKGVELGKDPGDQAIIDWVNNYAGLYRKEYNQSLSIISGIVFDKVKTKMPEVDEVLLHKISDLVIEEFTKIWITEVAKETKHVNEI